MNRLQKVKEEMMEKAKTHNICEHCGQVTHPDALTTVQGIRVCDWCLEHISGLYWEYSRETEDDEEAADEFLVSI